MQRKKKAYHFWEGICSSIGCGAGKASWEGFASLRGCVIIAAASGQQFSPRFFLGLQNPHACPEQRQCCHLLVAPCPHELGKASGPARVGRGSGTLTSPWEPHLSLQTLLALLPLAEPERWDRNRGAEVLPKPGMGQGEEEAGKRGEGWRIGMPESWSAAPCSVPPSQIRDPGPGPCWKGHCFRKQTAGDGGLAHETWL